MPLPLTAFQLKLREPVPQPELDPRSYGFTEADLDRPIFIDKVLGLEQATIRQMVDILQRTYCNTLGVEFMHISDPEQKGWIQARIEGPDKEITFTPEGSAVDPVTGDPVDGTIFLGRTNELESYRAVTVTGVTAITERWRWSNTAWVTAK